MKKTILTGAALIAFAAVSIAQTTNNVASSSQVGQYQSNEQTQRGSRLRSTVTQGSGNNTTLNTYNKAKTDQSGTYQEATVSQDGDADYNQAVITQKVGGPTTSNKNTATIRQQTTSGGTSFRSTLPGIGTAGTGNYGEVVQQGSANTASISQQTNSSGNYGLVQQYGTGNTQADIIQDVSSDGNSAQIKQGANGLPVSGNKAVIEQKLSSTTNDALITQASSGNTAEVFETSFSSSNTARINQSGGASTGSVRQDNNSSFNSANLIQIGDQNVGTITQTGFSGGAGVGNTAELYQRGSNNTQTSIGQGSTSYNNTAILNQYGSNNQITRISQSDMSYNNTARIDMGGDGPNGTYGAYGYSVNGGTAIIDQNNNSHDNKARIGQSGDGHNGQIYQINNVSNSEAYIDQYPGGAGNNIGYIKQENQTSGLVRITQNQNTYPGGNYGQNEARAFQGSSSYGVSSGNIMTIVQENNGNKSFSEQLGMNNLMEIKQYGDGNLVYGPGGPNRADGIAHQEGSLNKAYITQTAGGGISNSAYLNQVGTGNTATITQVGGVSVAP